MLPAFVVGAVLGVANVLFVAIAVAALGDAEAGAWVVLLGLFPGILAGTVLGVVAGITRTLPSPLRTALVFVPAALVVVALGCEYRMHGLILPALVPTLVGAAMLERATRGRRESRLPLARVMSR